MAGCGTMRVLLNHSALEADATVSLIVTRAYKSTTPHLINSPELLPTRASSKDSAVGRLHINHGGSRDTSRPHINNTSTAGLICICVYICICIYRSLTSVAVASSTSLVQRMQQLHHATLQA
jgi:hypothetical protein